MRRDHIPGRGHEQCAHLTLKSQHVRPAFQPEHQSAHQLCLLQILCPGHVFSSETTLLTPLDKACVNNLKNVRAMNELYLQVCAVELQYPCSAACSGVNSLLSDIHSPTPSNTAEELPCLCR